MRDPLDFPVRPHIFVGDFQTNHTRLYTYCSKRVLTAVCTVLYIPMSTADQAKSKNSTRAVYAILALLTFSGSSDLKKINEYIFCLSLVYHPLPPFKS